MSLANAIKNDKLKKIRQINKQILQMGLQKKLQMPIRLKFRESVKVHPKKKGFIDIDPTFIEDIQKITKSRQNVLISLLDNTTKRILTDEQCDQIDFRARIHYKANIVNKNTDNQFNEIQEKYRCNCGCQRAKGEHLSLLANIKKMSILGSGVVLLFMFKKTFSYILLMTVFIYAIFAILTNLLGNSSTTVKQCQDAYCRFRTQASSENKLQPGLFTIVQWWMGVAFCFVWIFILRLIKYFGKSEDQDIDNYLNSSSDYAVIIQNLPFGEYEQSELITYFDLLYQKAKKMTPQILNQNNQGDSESNMNDKMKKQDEEQKDKNKFNMKNIQVIYNMQFSRKINQKIIGLAMNIKSLYDCDKQTQTIRIKQRNIEQYKSLKRQICQTVQFMTDLRKKFFYDQNFRKQISTTVALIQFDKPKDKDNFLKYFGNQKIGIMKEVQQRIKSYFKKPSRAVMFRGKVLKIMRAPQPSDIIYTNCQKKYSINRFLLIWLLTFAIIFLSFGLITVLIYFQDYLAKVMSQTHDATSDNKDDTTITVLNIVISVGLQIVNRVLWLSLFYILDIEYNHTMTQKIISQMNKVLIATCINIIVLPIISNYVLRNNVYGSNGLAGMVFDYQISVLGVGLVMKFIDPSNFFKRVLLSIRKIRNMIIRFVCQNVHDINASKGVSQVNTLYQGGYFNIAQSYVYVMAATFQAAFFCQLQPSLLILVTLVVVLFYWVNKFKVLRACKIPQITEVLIFQTALSQAALIPIVYGTGTIAISYIESHYNPNLPVNYWPAFISIGIGFFGFFNPGDWLNRFVNHMMDKLMDNDQKTQTKAEQTTMTAQQMLGMNKNALSDEISNQQPQQMTRLDNYFRNTNSLPLIGFQHILQGGAISKFPAATLKQLQQFCQKFVQNEDYNRRGQKKVQKKINELIVNRLLLQKQDNEGAMGSQLKIKRVSVDMDNNMVLKNKMKQMGLGKRQSKIRLQKIQSYLRQKNNKDGK